MCKIITQMFKQRDTEDIMKLLFISSCKCTAAKLNFMDANEEFNQYTSYRPTKKNRLLIQIISSLTPLNDLLQPIIDFIPVNYAKISQLLSSEMR